MLQAFLSLNLALTKNARELMQQIQPLIDPLEGGWQMKALSLCTEGARVVKSNFFRPLSR